MSAGRVVVAALGALALAACSEETIVLATVPETTDGGRPPEILRCVRTADCPRDAFCDKPACDAPTGICRRVPTFCPPEERPTCGCNGISYFNDCLRRAAGVEASTPDECAAPLACNRAAPCPDGATCALLVAGPGAECAPEPEGVCWVVPPTCPPPLSPDRWESCVPGGERCISTCEAILRGVPYRRAGRCL